MEERVVSLIKEEFEIENTAFSANQPDEELVIKLLADRIDYMLQSNPDMLMSMMYRMDVREKDLQEALQPGKLDEPTRALALLVIKRQQERLETRRKYGPAEPGAWWLDEN
jgi:hypothetical protein